MDRPKLANCSLRDIQRACKKLGGCVVQKAGRHVVKVVHLQSQKAFVIPTGVLKKGLMWDFVRSFLQDVCGYSEEQIFKVLWC